MTGVFYAGPLAAVLGFILAAALTRPAKSASAAPGNAGERADPGRRQ
jgi:hypothetical protein